MYEKLKPFELEIYNEFEVLEMLDHRGCDFSQNEFEVDDRETIYS